MMNRIKLTHRPSQGTLSPYQAKQPSLRLLTLACLLLSWHSSSAVAATSDPSQSTRDLPQICARVGAPEGVIFETSPRWVEGQSLPPHCEISGIAAGKIRFVMRLPIDWQGRFMLSGCGGFCGELRADFENRGNGINYAVRRGYAAISHDGGHQAPSWETGWAADPEALEIWAHKLLPILTDVGVALAEAVYGQAPQYRYFAGCSNGGRLGMMAAQRYPGLFDGIAAGGSVGDLSGIAGLWGIWMTQLTVNNGQPVIAPARWAAIHQKILSRCDALDGRNDQRIDQPRQCSVDFRQFMTGDDPLSATEADTLNALYGGVRNTNGEIIYPSLELGSEFFGDIWMGTTGERDSWGVLASKGYRELLAMSLGQSPAEAPSDIAAVQAMVARSSLPALTNSVDQDLSRHAAAGSKLLLYHGLADPLIIPQPIEDYYSAAAEKAGSFETLREHTRLFMVPGWGHCWERPSASGDDFDPLAAVEAWVERGSPPDTLPLHRRDGQGTDQIPMR